MKKLIASLSLLALIPAYCQNSLDQYPTYLIRKSKPKPGKESTHTFKLYIHGTKVGSISTQLQTDTESVIEKWAQDSGILVPAISTQKATITKIKVYPLFRNQGNGSLLLAFALNNLINNPQVVSIKTNAVNTANTAATALLHHFGFSLNEVTKHADGTTTASFIIPVEEVTYNDAFKKSLF